MPRPYRKHDWVKLKAEFMTGDFVTVADFLRTKDMDWLEGLIK